jgi:hypothetical protein
MTTYKIVRHYQRSYKSRIIDRGLTLTEAQQHCRDPETSSKTALIQLAGDGPRRAGLGLTATK